MSHESQKIRMIGLRCVGTRIGVSWGVNAPANCSGIVIKIDPSDDKRKAAALLTIMMRLSSSIQVFVFRFLFYSRSSRTGDVSDAFPPKSLPLTTSTQKRWTRALENTLTLLSSIEAHQLVHHGEQAHRITRSSYRCSTTSLQSDHCDSRISFTSCCIYGITIVSWNGSPFR